jgi:hypothetical protein
VFPGTSEKQKFLKVSTRAHSFLHFAPRPAVSEQLRLKRDGQRSASQAALGMPEWPPGRSLRCVCPPSSEQAGCGGSRCALCEEQLGLFRAMHGALVECVHYHPHTLTCFCRAGLHHVLALAPLTPAPPRCLFPPAERRRLVVRAAGPTAECDCPPAPLPKAPHWQQTLDELGELRDIGCQVSATAVGACFELGIRR